VVKSSRAVVRTSARVRWLPFPLAPSDLLVHGGTFPHPPDALVAFPGTLRCRYHRSHLLKLGMKIYSYNDHVRLLSPELVGWISTTNFTRAREPTLSPIQVCRESCLNGFRLASHGCGRRISPCARTVGRTSPARSKAWARPGDRRSICSGRVVNPTISFCWVLFAVHPP
jgi:hypothetical protein